MRRETTPRLKSVSQESHEATVRRPVTKHYTVSNFCDCTECKIYGVHFPARRFHDCGYRRKRSSLVPQVEKAANERVRYIKGDKGNAAK